MKSILSLLLWTAIVTYLSLMPVNIDSLPPFSGFDKAVHFTFYFVMSVLILMIKTYKGMSKYITALLLPAFYGFFIECLQSELNTGRHFDNFDIIANIIGCLTGTLVFYYFRKI